MVVSSIATAISYRHTSNIVYVAHVVVQMHHEHSYIHVNALCKRYVHAFLSLTDRG